MAQLMPLPLTVSCFSKIQIGVTFLIPAHPGSPGKGTVKRVCVCHLLRIFRAASCVLFVQKAVKRLYIGLGLVGVSGFGLGLKLRLDLAAASPLSAGRKIWSIYIRWSYLIVSREATPICKPVEYNMHGSKQLFV